MLDYRFSPRFKDLEVQRFWKAQMPGGEALDGHGPLGAIVRNRVNVKKVLAARPDMLRVAGSLITNQVRASPSCAPRATSPGRGCCPVVPAQPQEPQRPGSLHSCTPSTPREGLRPLRGPDAVELDGDDDGMEK
nr:Tn3 family transposase [Streptomyces sp. L2]